MYIDIKHPQLLIGSGASTAYVEKDAHGYNEDLIYSRIIVRNIPFSILVPG